MTPMDTPMQRHFLLLEPLTLSPQLTLRNRIVMTAHTDVLGRDQAPSDRQIAYLARRAEGGAGLIVTGAAAVHPTSGAFEQMPNPNPSDPLLLERFERLAEAIHAHGASVVGQLYHCGGQSATDYFTDRPLWAPSEGRGMLSQLTAHAMTKREIGEVVAAFASGAANFQRAGFDGVEIHGSHGYLIQQFISPLTNRRTDEYGGSLENRLRFAIEVLQAVRQATGASFAIGYRHCAVERMPGGIELDGAIEVARRLDATGLISYFSVSNGTHESYEELIPSVFIPQGKPAAYAALIKPHVSAPVVAVGRVNHPSLAEELLSRGDADLVGMLRALIADPDLPKRIEAGDLRLMRPCLGLNVCADRIHVNAQLRCGVNPRAALEDLPEPDLAGHGRRVAVVGGGPAGLEAAATVAESGAEVTLFEAGDRVGGMLATASRFPVKAEYGGLLAYFHQRLSEANALILLNSPVEQVEPLFDEYDAVVVATGSRWEPVAWHDRAEDQDRHYGGPLFRGGWAELLDRDFAGERVVLVQRELADHVALTIAHHMLSLGAELHIVSSFGSATAGLDAPFEHFANKLLAAYETRVYAPASVLPSEGDTVRVHHWHLREQIEIVKVAAVISSGSRRANLPADAVALFDAGRPLWMVGDCVSPRGLAQAIREGHHAAAQALQPVLAGSGVRRGV
jgi:2,4-dienoyl-CoA reductase (NADPH2)